MTHILLFYPQLMSAMTNKLSKQEDPLPQDLAEGVDEDEWVRQQTYIPVIDFYMLVSCIHGYFCYFFFSNFIFCKNLHLMLVINMLIKHSWQLRLNEWGNAEKKQHALKKRTLWK